MFKEKKNIQGNLGQILWCLQFWIAIVWASSSKSFWLAFFMMLWLFCILQQTPTKKHGKVKPPLSVPVLGEYITKLFQKMQTDSTTTTETDSTTTDSKQKTQGRGRQEKVQAVAMAMEQLMKSLEVTRVPHEGAYIGNPSLFYSPVILIQNRSVIWLFHLKR